MTITNRALSLSLITLLFFNFGSVGQANNRLHEEIEAGNLQEVIRLLDSGISVNARFENSVYNTATPLITAAWTGKTEIAGELIRRGADVNAVNQGDQTALFAAANEGNTPLVKLLLENGAKDRINYQSLPHQKTPLNAALSNYHIATATVLILNGADVNLASEIGDTPLHAAATGGFSDMVQLLIAFGADVNRAQDSSNFTPLHAAAFMGHEKIMKILIAHGANQETRNWLNKNAQDMLNEHKKRKR